MKRTALVFATILWATFYLGPGTAEAQEDLGVRSFGFRGGVTIDPDQVHIGMHINAGQLLYPHG